MTGRREGWLHENHENRFADGNALGERIFETTWTTLEKKTNRTKGDKECGRTAAGLPECETACKRKTSVNTHVFHNLTRSVDFTAGGAASCRAQTLSIIAWPHTGGASTPCEPFRPGRTTILVVRENSARDAPGVGPNGGRRVDKGSRGFYSNVSNAASRTRIDGVREGFYMEIAPRTGTLGGRMW